jgi:hypothetical protein
MKRLFAAIIILFFFLAVKAQKPEDILSKWSATSPIEKAYLHFDRENYIAGETTWFKAYLCSYVYPDTISTTLYVELVSESNVVHDREIAPIFWGVANGHLTIPSSLTTGNYAIRAYTATMLNHGEDFIFNRTIFIYGKEKEEPPMIVDTIKKGRLEFFPEGGNLVTGFLNAVAFKATNTDGLPIVVTGSLRNEKDQELVTFNSYHDGMGKFVFTPQSKEKYYVVLSNNPLNRYYLPASTDKGIILTVVNSQPYLSFKILQSTTDSLLQAAYAIGQMQNRVVFRQELAAGKQQASWRVNTNKLNSGILQITAFNKDGVPLAERLCFIDNKEYIQKGELVVDTLNFTGKARNHFSLLLKDTVQGNFSVSVTDPAYDLLAARQHNIYSCLLLTSDIKGYVHNPAWYFTANPDSAKKAVDLVMMVNGWRRFKWEDLSKSKLPGNGYKDLSYITLSGKVNILDSRKPFANKNLFITLNNSNSTSAPQMIATDARGYFRLDSMFFWGNMNLLFNDVRGDRRRFIEVKMSADSLTKSFSLQPIEKRPSFITTSSYSLQQAKLATDYDEIQKAAGLILKEVTVRSKRQKTSTELLEERYASGLFSGLSDYTIDLVSNNELIPQSDIFSFLQSRIPSITFTSEDGSGFNGGTLYYRGGRFASLKRPVPMALFLNETRTDAIAIASIRPSDISLIKVYSNFAGAGDALAVYTKKGEDTRPSGAQSSSVYQVLYKGYSVDKEFYSPDYHVKVSDNDNADNRITLHWIPYLSVADIDPKLPIVFYNSDRTKQFRIVIEGMTSNGKMLMIEKTIGIKGF